MDQGDIEMVDAETPSHTELDSVKAPQDSTPDGAEFKTAPAPAPLPELDASLENTDDSKKSHEVENGNTQLSVDSAVVEEQKKTELEQVQESSLPRKEEEEEKELEMVSENQTTVDQNLTGEETNGNVENEQEDEAKSLANGDAEQQDCARIEDNGDAKLQNKAEGETETETETPAAETETQAEVDFTSAVQEQASTENGKEVNGTLDTVMEENTASEIALEGVGEKPASEIAVDEIGKEPASEIAVDEMGEKPASEIDVVEIGERPAPKIAEEEVVHSHVGELPFQLPVSEIPPKKKEASDEIHSSRSGEITRGLAPEVNHSETADLVKTELDNKPLLPAATPVTKPAAAGSPYVNKPSPATPELSLKYSSRRSAGYSDAKMAENVEGTPEQQAAFIKELEVFYRQRGVEFKTPKFYGNPLNCYKLWTSVIRLGGYDLVTGTKLWRQIGESFHPPKTCTTVSWTFRIFYEKSLLDYERYKVQNGEVELPVAPLPEPPSADNEGNGHQASGSGRARRDSATRAMQGWHAQRLYGEDKSPISMQKRENKIKSIGSLKQKRPNEGELQPFVKTPRTETPKQLVPTIADVGAPADWVKINVRETKDCFEVYALVPGLLREEVRVQSDPAGRLVITGQPEQLENPWGITPFRKVVSLPGRIDPLGTSAVVSLHGRLFVRVPFEQTTTN